MPRILTIGLLYIGLFFTLSFGGQTKPLVTDLSVRKIEIRYSFQGADLILFGAVSNKHVEGDYDVIVAVKGPSGPITVRRKSNVGGIWMNTDYMEFPKVPHYYAIAANRDIQDIASSKVMRRLGIGFDNLPISPKNPETQGLEAYKKALNRGKTRAGLYRQGVDTVTIVGGGLFRTDVHLPANVPVGKFSVEAFIIQNGKLIAQNHIPMSVDKEGFERAVYDYAHNFPFLYGLTAVFIALGAGWLAGAAGLKK